MRFYKTAQILCFLTNTPYFFNLYSKSLNCLKNIVLTPRINYTNSLELFVKHYPAASYNETKKKKMDCLCNLNSTEIVKHDLEIYMN